MSELPAALKENSSRVELWAKFINAEETEEFNMIAKKTRISKALMTSCSESAKMNRNVWNTKRERKLSLITIKACLKQNSAASETLHATFSHLVLIFMSLQKQPIYP